MSDSATDEVSKLIDACCDVVFRPEFQPMHGITHCNEAVNIVCQRMGYAEFRGMVANQIVDFMSRSSNWEMVPIENAQEIANEGRLVIAGEGAEPHGHVCMIRPGVVSTAGYWGCMAPKVANVGGTNFINKGLNFAFREKPRIWALKKEISQ